MLEAILGSTAAERVLFFLQNYEQGYGREIAATFGLAPISARIGPAAGLVSTERRSQAGS